MYYPPARWSQDGQPLTWGCTFCRTTGSLDSFNPILEVMQGSYHRFPLVIGRWRLASITRRGQCWQAHTGQQGCGKGDTIRANFGQSTLPSSQTTETCTVSPQTRRTHPTAHQSPSNWASVLSLLRRDSSEQWLEDSKHVT